MTFVIGLALGCGIGIGAVLTAQETLKRGVFDTTTTPGKTGAQLEIVHQDAGIGLIQDSLPANTSNETFIAGFGYSSVGVLAKQFSISSKWVNPSKDNGYSVLRLNSTFFEPVTQIQRDDVAVRIFGGQGIAVFGTSDAAGGAPGRNVLQINGTLKYPASKPPDTHFTQVRYLRVLDENNQVLWIPAYR